jgi:hypothetical protein
MNASRRCVIMAEGVLCYARWMDTPTDFDSPQKQAWLRWEAANDKMVLAVIRSQIALFDAANAIGHGLGHVDGN